MMHMVQDSVDAMTSLVVRVFLLIALNT